MTTDREAIVACQEGLKESYRFLVEKYKVRAYHAAFAWTGNAEEAMDISQEAFYRAYRSLKKVDPEKNFYTWLYKIIKNLSINYLKKSELVNRINRPADGLTIDSNYSNMADTPDWIYEENEKKQLLWRAINILDLRDKEIIILKEFQEMSYQEIADTLEIPIGSVMSRLYYARKKLIKTVGFLIDE
ncbi:MAG: RNA polymerase sigma factor [Calditrichaceae bacterium]